MISSNSNKVPVVIKTSQEEQRMITTDRAELEAMLKELKQDAAQAARKEEKQNDFKRIDE